MDNSPSPAEPPDPFALPSETDAHFTLLIISVIGSSILLYTMLFNAIPAFWDAKQAEIQRCTDVVTAAIPGSDIQQQGQRLELRQSCERSIRVLQASWELGGCAVLIGVALGLYWWLPARTLRRSRFRTLDQTHDPELVASVGALAREVGLHNPPHIVCNPLNRSGGGVAFGRWRSRYLGLYGGTLLRFRRQPDVFRGVVLHELAHLRNADLDKATLAVTIWWAFLLVAVLPTTVGTVLAGLFQPDRAFALGWRLMVVAGLVALTRAAVLRERELYADQRAWRHGAPGLARALEQLAEPLTLARLKMPDFMRRALAMHPSPAERRATLAEPAALFRFSPWTAFAAGMVTTLALESVAEVANGFTSGLTNATFAAVVMAVPLAGVLALSMWRDEAYRRHVDRPAPQRSTLGLGLALGAGLVAGWRASIVVYAYEDSPFRLQGLPAVVFELGVLALCLLSMALFVAWLRAGARAWLPRLGWRRRSLRGGLVAATIAATVLLAGVLAYISYGVLSSVVGIGGMDPAAVAGLAEFGLPTDLSPVQAVLVLGFGVSLLQLIWVPQAPLILALVWGFPLLAGCMPEAAGQRPRWRLVGAVSLVMGLVTAPAFVAVAFSFVDSANVLAFAIAGPLVFGLFQTSAALLVRLRVRDFAVLHALAAAHLTGLVAVAVLIGLGAIAGFELPWHVVGSIGSGGLLLAGLMLLMLEPLVAWRVGRQRGARLPSAAGVASGSG